MDCDSQNHPTYSAIYHTLGLERDELVAFLKITRKLTLHARKKTNFLAILKNVTNKNK